MADNVTTTWKFLRGKGLSPAQAAGIIGTMQGESGQGLDPGAVNPTSGARGIAQWLGGRAQGLPNDIGGQLNHLWKELQGPEKGAFSAIRGAHTIEDATKAWLTAFERPAASEMNLGARTQNARNVFKRLSGVSGGDFSSTLPPAMAGAVQPTQAPSDSGLTQLSSILQRLEASTPQPYKSPFDDLSAQADTGRPSVQLGNYQSTYQPPKLSETIANLAAMQAPTASPVSPISPGATGGGGTADDNTPPPEGGKGTTKFDGTPVAGWIAPILQYARSQGWKGKVNSGFRSFADQTRIYNSGVRPAAKPGTSNHEGSEYPRGAVDVSDAAQLSEILKRSKYKNVLQWAGSKDPVHFSHPHGGSY